MARSCLTLDIRLAQLDSVVACDFAVAVAVAVAFAVAFAVAVAVLIPCIGLAEGKPTSWLLLAMSPRFMNRKI